MPVLHDVSLTLAPGELVGLIGPNGCGKSTLLRCLTRTLRIVSGSITLDGRDLMAWSPREAACRIAFVPQQEAALFEFTVRDLVLMGRHPHLQRWKGETDSDYRIVHDALASADLLHLADRPVTRLSGGEHRRVLLARALAQQTPLLLLDEPTAHLDVTHQVDLLTLVREQTRGEGQGALAALHDLNQAAEFCDRLVLMCDGRIVAAGEPEAVLTPANLRSAYNADARIGCNPATGRPMLLAVAAPHRAPNSNGARAHVICGGGTGIGVLGKLVRAGFTVTAGVLNALDSDCSAATALSIDTSVEAPFSPIGAESRAAAARMIAAADVVLITPLPVGLGNLANIELAAEAQAAGKPVVLLGDASYAARDFTGGEATALLQRLASGGAQYASVEDWIAADTDANTGATRSETSIAI